ncbi:MULTISPECIES: DoxX family protein [Pseudomonas]|uniref:Putative oxidoreductase n=1 Tax=Pseudomonas segetis TaxID=298908 RepID=A0A239AEI0_9PSED|nr:MULTISPECIES: DoxX family protein [Pseudomonas]SNR93771.1 putative oxidoreductase [Pseudomonas segetis]
MNALIKSLTTTHAGYGLTVLRVIVGLTFAAHGSQKLFGWFDGPGLEGVGQWMESLGMTPGYLFALLAGSAEFFGGLALIIGLLVRPAALALSVTMLVAIFSVHISNGFFMSANGYEFALALLAASVAILIEGAGKLSVDQRLSI